jgi:maltose-binding protein MalE
MSKILRVIDPFFTMDVDDTFTLSNDGKCYISERNEEFHTAKEDGDLNSTYSSTFKLSPRWAQQLIEEGYLEEVTPEKPSKDFVNVFDEIDKLIEKYNAELIQLPKTMADTPECLRVEKTTVLTNLLKVLNYLKSLRK